jgi:hypothetical protein
MGVGDGVEHRPKPPQAPVDAEPSAPSSLENRPPLDQLECKIRAPVGSNAGVEKLRDVGMRQPGEDVPLAPKPSPKIRPRPAEVGQLECNPALVRAVAAVGAPDGPHPAHSQLGFERVGPDDGSLAKSILVIEEIPGRGLELGGIGLLAYLGLEHRSQGLDEVRPLSADALEPYFSILLMTFERLVE